MLMSAPIACRPFTCWSTGRSPIAQPPGSETFARPQRARSGPRTRTDARIVFTRSYAAVGFDKFFESRIRPFAERSTSTPICAMSFAMVAMSIRRGMLLRVSGLAVSSAAHMIGSAAFLAPETATSPSSGRPPLILSLSTRLPLRGREGAHRQRVDLLAHALAQGRVHELVALHAAAPGKLFRHDERLEVLAVAQDFDVLAGEPALDAGFRAFRGDHFNTSAYSPI